MFFISGSGKYIYYETSDPRMPGDRIVLRGPSIQPESPTQCLKFAFHMYGSDMGTLQLDQVKSDGFSRSLFSRDRVNVSQWQYTQITLYPEYFAYNVSSICT